MDIKLEVVKIRSYVNSYQKTKQLKNTNARQTVSDKALGHDKTTAIAISYRIIFFLYNKFIAFVWVEERKNTLIQQFEQDQ
jgi:hypothetical protein